MSLESLSVCLATIAGVEMFPLTVSAVKCWEDLIIVTLLIMESLPLNVGATFKEKNRTAISDTILGSVYLLLFLLLPKYLNTDPTEYALYSTQITHLNIPFTCAICSYLLWSWHTGNTCIWLRLLKIVSGVKIVLICFCNALLIRQQCSTHIFWDLAIALLS